MLFPVRCFSCNACLPSDVYDAKLKQGVSAKDALDSLRIERLCCRRMLISHPHSLEESLMPYPNVDKTESELFLDIRCRISTPRTITCD